MWSILHGYDFCMRGVVELSKYCQSLYQQLDYCINHVDTNMLILTKVLLFILWVIIEHSLPQNTVHVSGIANTECSYATSHDSPTQQTVKFLIKVSQMPLHCCFSPQYSATMHHLYVKRLRNTIPSPVWFLRSSFTGMQCVLFSGNCI